MESIFLTFHLSCERFPAQLRGLLCDPPIARFLYQDTARMSRGEVSESSLSRNSTLFSDHTFPIFMCAGVILSLCGEINSREPQSLQPFSHSLPPVHYWQLLWNKGLAVQQPGINARHLPAKWLLKTNVPLVAFVLISWTLKDLLVHLQHQLSSHC